MQKNQQNESNWLGNNKMVIMLVALILLGSTTISTSVSAAPNKDALKTVVHFLTAQKDCDVQGMINYSENTFRIANRKEFYTRFCKEHPLKEAKITDLSIVNHRTALVSIESTYKDKIFIGTTPVIKKNDQWKIIKGIQGSGYVEFSNHSNKNSQDVRKAIDSYSNAMKSGNLTEMKKHIKILPQNADRVNNYHKALSKGPEQPTVTSFGINTISDTFAIAQIEVKHKHFSTTENYAVCKENGQWKIVLGRHLTMAAIPTSEKLVEIK